MTNSKLFLPIAFCFSCLCSSAQADDPASKFVSGAGTAIYLGVGTLASLFQDGKHAKEHTARTVDALISTALLTTALKATVREKRPDSNERDSFPSAHTSLAFTVAAMQSRYHPRQAPYWYGGAALIGVSRITLRRHHVQDVLAGAALGYFTARWELRSKNGLILRPVIQGLEKSNNSLQSSRFLGVGIAKSF